MIKKPTLFISYRRDPSVDLARLLYEHLRKKGVKVFYDYESLNAGRFDSNIEKSIITSDHFLLILAPGTLDSEWVRKEIATALRHQKNIIPMFTRGFTAFPEASMGEIDELRRFNGFHYHQDQSPEPTIATILKRMDHKGWQSYGLVLVAAVAVVIVGVFLLTQLFTPSQPQATPTKPATATEGQVSTLVQPSQQSTLPPAQAPTDRPTATVPSSSTSAVTAKPVVLWRSDDTIAICAVEALDLSSLNVLIGKSESYTLGEQFPSSQATAANQCWCLRQRGGSIPVEGCKQDNTHTVANPTNWINSLITVSLNGKPMGVCQAVSSNRKAYECPLQ